MLLIVSFVDAVVLLWGHPWWLQLAVAVVVVIIALGVGFGIRAARPGRRTYASSEARLAIAKRRRGWYIADHVARPGSRGAGRRQRLRIRDELVTAADTQRVVIYAHTTSDKLARAYMEDIPGLRVAAVHGKRILLVRPPRRHAR